MHVLIRYLEAKNAFVNSVLLNPQDCHVWFNLATVQYKRSDHAWRHKCLVKCLTLLDQQLKQSESSTGLYSKVYLKLHDDVTTQLASCNHLSQPLQASSDQERKLIALLTSSDEVNDTTLLLQDTDPTKL